MVELIQQTQKSHTPTPKEPLHLIMDTDFGLDDVCALLYLLYEMFTSRKVIIHHISVCQGQQLNTLNGVKQIYSMLKYCNVPVSKFSALNADSLSLSHGRNLKNVDIVYKNKENIDSATKKMEKIIHDFAIMKDVEISEQKIEQIAHDAVEEMAEKKAEQLLDHHKDPNTEEIDVTTQNKNLQSIFNAEEVERICHLFTEGDWYEVIYNAQNHFCQEIQIPFAENFTCDIDYEIVNTDSVEALLQLVNDRPNFYTLFAIGPLTNISDVLKRDEKWLTKLKGAYFMAGNFMCPGNTPNIVSEWNIYADPWSARHVFDHLEKYPLLSTNNNQTSKYCRLLGLEVANLDVYPVELQRTALQKGHESINEKLKLSEDSLPKNWNILRHLSDILNRVMTLHQFACSFDVVAAMAMTRHDIVFEYHRLRCSIDRRSPREGECVVFVDEEVVEGDEVDSEKSTDVQEFTETIEYNRTVSRSNIQGTDFEEVQLGATVDIGVKINTNHFQKVIEHILRGELIPDSISS